MGSTTLQKKGEKRFSLKDLSIQKRLPLLICILLLCVIIAFGLTSYIGVKKAALEMGRERIKTLSEQLSSMFGQAAKDLTSGTHTVANQPPIKNYVLNGGRGPDTAALPVLQKLQLDSSWILVELYNAQWKPLLRTGATELKLNKNLDSVISFSSPGPDSCKIGKLVQVGDSIYYAIVAAVTDHKQFIGYLVRWRLQKATAKAIAQFSELLGSDVILLVGNADGTLWSDMNKVVSAPPLDTKPKDGFFEYATPKGGQATSTIRPIAFTPWFLLIEVPQQRLLEAANRFRNWILILGSILLIAGIFAAWLMSRNITKPLKTLTAAAATIASGDYSASVEIGRSDELGKLAGAFNTMAQQVGNARYNLEKIVEERTTQLQKANKELEAFSYSVSHDLRAPLRSISGFAMILKEDYVARLDPEANRLTDKIITNAKMMGRLIDDLISFSKMGRTEIDRQIVDMKKLVESCVAETLQREGENKCQTEIHPLPACYGDQNLIKQVWMNLISNAVKYSSKNPVPRVEIGCTESDDKHTYYVRDNGVGFDMKYAHKLFGVFQRLHSQKEFEGTGLGLALAKRIINQHNGDIWSEASTGEGAVFYFSLPKSKLP